MSYSAAIHIVSPGDFDQGTAQTPGRLNFVEIGDVTVLMDYAHNPAGLRGLANFIGKLPHKYRTVVLNGTGDRRDDDIRLLDARYVPGKWIFCGCNSFSGRIFTAAATIGFDLRCGRE